MKMTAAAAPILAAAFAGALALLPAALIAQTQNGPTNSPSTATPNGASVVTPVAYVSLDQVPRGRAW